jgi:hypothetical protein
MKTSGVPPPFPPNGKPIDTMEPLSQEPFNARIHFLFMTIIKISGMLLGNQLSRVPITSNRGNKYIVIFYINNANLSNPSPSKAGQRRSSCGLTGWFMLISQHGASNRNFTRWTTRSLMMLKHSFAKRTHTSGTPHPTSTAPIRRNGKFICGRIASSPTLLGFQRPSQSQIGVISSIKQTSPSTCYSHAVKILLYWRSRHSKGLTHLMQHRWLR